jgi:VIT1/CCC1 family predicted Fe2+/Mn2+ transporter
MSEIVDIGTVQAAFTADTGSFDASVTGVGRQLSQAGDQAQQAAAKISEAGSTIDRVAAMQERAAERARSAWSREKLQQDLAIDRQKEAARAAEILALRNDILARNTEVAAAAQQHLNSAMEGGVPKMAAASGAVRLLEGGMNNNVRAAERFLTTTLGFGPVLAKAFPVVGALAMVGVLSELIEHAVKFGNDTDELKNRLGIGWLDAAIGQLDGLKRAAEQADEVLLDIARDSDSLRVSNRTLDIEKIRLTKSPGAAFRAQASDLTDPTSGYVAKQAAILSVLQLEQSKIQAQLKAADIRMSPVAGVEVSMGDRGFMSTQDIAKARVRLSEVDAEVKNVRDHMAEAAKQAEVFNLQAAKADVKTGKKSETAARELADKEMEAARQRLEAMKAAHVMSYQEEADYWQKLANTAKRGSLLYSDALMEANKARAGLVKQAQKELGEAVVSMVEDQISQREASDRISEAVQGAWEAGQKRDEEQAKQLRESAEQAFKAAVEQQKAAEKLAEERVKLDEAAGRISHLGAAREMQSIHQDAFAAWSQSASQLRSLYPDMSTPGAAEELGKFAGQTDADKQRVDLATVMGSLRDETVKLRDSFGDLPAQLRGIESSFTNSMNDEMAKAITGQKTNWSGAFRGQATTLAKTGLQQAESAIMKQLHITAAVVNLNASSITGMPGSGASWQNPLGTAFNGTNWTASSSTSIFSSLAGLLNGSASAPGAIDASGLAGSGSQFGSSSLAALFAPAMAFGGPVLAGQPYNVGEMGREVFVPHSNGSIVPNHSLSGGNTYYHIDASGASAAEVEQRVGRIMQQYHGSAVRTAVAATREQQRRSPRGR